MEDALAPGRRRAVRDHLRPAARSRGPGRPATAPAAGPPGVRILWQAARPDFLLSTGLQTVGGLGTAVRLLLGQRALQALLEASRGGGSVAGVLPWAVAVATVAALMFFASAVQRERQQILGELVSRHVEERVLDQGKVVEGGTHHALMGLQGPYAQGPYADLFTLQARA